MVENSVGRAWKASNPDSLVDKSWDYYLFREEKLSRASFEIESIQILDPACGSGHILVYVFELLFAMYEEMGYLESSIPSLIVKNNLFGLDIDARATQLATLALMMKAREKDRKFFERDVAPNVLAFQDAADIPDDIIQLVAHTPSEIHTLRELLTYHKNARQFGSLLEGYPIDTHRFFARIAALDENSGDMVDKASVLLLRSRLLAILRQNAMLQNTYDIVITNPPYHNKYNPVLKDFMAKTYKDYKSDLYSAFIFRCAHWTIDHGYTAMMTPFTWMFISSHEKLRKSLLQQFSISSLVQLEYSGFEEATVPICTFVVQHQTDDRKGVYLRLEEFKGPDLQPVKVREAVVHRNVSYRYVMNSNEFDAIPGSPIAYWASKAVQRAFAATGSDSARPWFIGDNFAVKKGMDTGNNDRFLRLWFEVIWKRSRWVPYSKGGGYRRWYGNNDTLVFWEDDGKEVKNFPLSNIRNKDYYFHEAVTWGTVTSSLISARYMERGTVFDNGGSCAFGNDNLYYLLGLLNSKVSQHFLEILNPTLNYQPGDISRIPYFKDAMGTDHYSKIVGDNVDIAHEDWNDFETSWNFTQHPLVKYASGVAMVSEAYGAWRDHAEHRFQQMQANEVALNRMFIHLYGLHEELTPDVPDDDITLRRADEVREAKSFLSYFIGCLLGRYSLDIPGLAYAGGDWDETRYPTFGPVVDGVVLFTDDRYFEADVISRLEEFLTVLYGPDTVEENMQWLAHRVDQRTQDDAVTRLRRYFLQEFFKDHCKIYRKRPIYWLFDSGPQKGFRALIYLHRYHPDTVARVRLEYLQPLQRRVAEEMNQLEGRLAAANLSRVERQMMNARLDVLRSRQEECVRYDQVLADLANQRIALDLDDGVKVNYAQLQSALAPIK